MIELTPALFFPLYALQWVVTLFLLALVLGAYNHIDRLERRLQPQTSRLRKGDRLPADLDIELPARAFLVLFSYGCRPCIDLSRRLEDVGLGEWALITIASGSPLPREVARLPELQLPSGAQHIHDTERVWPRKLGADATPTALAFVGGRLVEQQVAPGLDWFERLVERPSTRKDKRKEVIHSTVTVG